MALNSFSRRSTVNNAFNLNWTHLSNAINHGLYDKIASSFIVLINNNKKYTEITRKNIHNIVKELQANNKLSPNEVKYIRTLIAKALEFQAVQKAKQMQVSYRGDEQQAVSKKCNMDQQTKKDIITALFKQYPLDDIFNGIKDA
eukprot:100930_1